MLLLEDLINGLLFGATYSLVAIGFTLIFGVIHRLNIAHGATIMASTFAGAAVAILLGGKSYLALLAAFVASTGTGVLLGFLIERIAFRPLKGADYLAPFATTAGVTIVLEELFLKLGRVVPIFHPEYTPFPSPLENLSFHIGGLYVRGVYVIIFIVALALMASLTYWIDHTRSGRAMRVVEQNELVARLMGINVRRVELTAFAVASGLAGAAGCLIGVSVGTVGPFMGTNLLMISFVVIVLGGLGSIRGAMVGGLVVGVVESLTISLLSARYKQAVLFLLLFLVLIFRPEGLLTRRTVVRD
ncbi:MAG: branched-chain amino acid ABC transporter permease [Burkholderiales bacterium]